MNWLQIILLSFGILYAAILLWEWGYHSGQRDSEEYWLTQRELRRRRFPNPQPADPAEPADWWKHDET
jgi:hypothetical protein